MASLINFIFLFCIFLTVYALEVKTNNQSTNQKNKLRRGLSNLDNETAAVYSEVMKNITRVNRVLEDLITNYEKLKNMYKSQELSVDYSSDDEIDLGFKAHKDRFNRANETIKTTTTPDLVGTAVFYSEEKNGDDDDDDDDGDAENTDDNSKAVTETSTEMQTKTTTENTVNSQSSEENNDINLTPTKSKESLETTKKRKKKTTTTTPVTTRIATRKKKPKKTSSKAVSKLTVKKIRRETTKKAKVSNKQTQQNDKIKDYASNEASVSTGWGNSGENPSSVSKELSIEMAKSTSKVIKTKHSKGVPKDRKKHSMSDEEVHDHESLKQYDEEESPTLKALETTHSKVLPKNPKVNSMSEEEESTGLKDDYTEEKQTRSNQSKHYRTVKAIVRTENFAPDTIWKDMLNNKPVKLAKQTEVLYNQQVMNFRAQTGLPDIQKTVLRTEPDDKKNKSIAESVLKELSKESNRDNKSKTPSAESREDEKTIRREQFKTKILRKAYGDACLKVVVKKCYKACKKASQDACRKYKCKSSFKNAFETSAKQNCIKEFREENQPTENKNTNEFAAISVRSNDNISENGLLAAACLPLQKPSQRRSANETPPTDMTIKLNILRDRFERECQKVSAEKCTIACRNASTEACNAEKCVSGKLTRLQKECKRYCKWSYSNKKGSSYKKRNKKHRSSSSDTATGSSSSSSSESDIDLTQKKEKLTNKKKLSATVTVDKKKLAKKAKRASEENLDIKDDVIESEQKAGEKKSKKKEKIKKRKQKKKNE